jgi:hypothetical protein
MSSAKDLRDQIIESVGVFNGTDGHTIEIDVDEEGGIILALLDANGEQQAIGQFGDLSAGHALLDLAQDLHKQMEERISDMQNAFKEELDMQLSDYKDFVDNYEVAEWREHFESLKDEVDEMFKRLERRSKEMDESSEMQDSCNDLESAMELFQKELDAKEMPGELQPVNSGLPSDTFGVN